MTALRVVGGTEAPPGLASQRPRTSWRVIVKRVRWCLLLAWLATIAFLLHRSHGTDQFVGNSMILMLGVWWWLRWGYHREMEAQQAEAEGRLVRVQVTVRRGWL